jgi:hypothetical protein
MKAKAIDLLTEKQKLFVEAYCGPAKGVGAQAYRDAGYKASENASDRAYRMLQNSKIQNAIEELKFQKKKAFWISEEDILKGIYEEATLVGKEGGTQQGRTQAWVYLGKHIGMFSDKKKEETAQQSITYNIVNYSDGGNLKEKIVKGIEENKEAILEHKLPEDSLIGITNYSEED